MTAVLQIWLEMPIHAPKNCFLGSGHLNVIGHHRDPKRYILGRNGDFGGDLSAGATWARAEETKKAIKDTLQWQTGCLLRPLTLSLWSFYKFLVHIYATFLTMDPTRPKPTNQLRKIV